VHLWSKWLTCCHVTGFRVSLIQQPESSGSEGGEAGEKQVRKFGRQSISLMLCRVLRFSKLIFNFHLNKTLDPPPDNRQSIALHVLQHLLVKAYGGRVEMAPKILKIRQ
jgi:hypothetical protein